MRELYGSFVDEPGIMPVCFGCRRRGGEVSMCRVSVIVPVYQVEAYLPACLDSILAQTFRDF